jgi:transposase
MLRADLNKRRSAWVFFAGLDVSLDAVAICIVGETGEIVWQGKVLGEPEAVKAALHRWRDNLVRVGLEAGATSEWIGGHLIDEGLPVVCLESRHVKAALSAMTMKTDRNDAQGIAQIVRTGWFKAVHLKSGAGQRLRTLTAARKSAVRALTGNEQVIRGLLRPLGLKIGAVTRVRFEARVRQLIGMDRVLLAIFEPLLRLPAREPGRSAPPRSQGGSDGSDLPSPHDDAWHWTRDGTDLQGDYR